MSLASLLECPRLFFRIEEQMNPLIHKSDQNLNSLYVFNTLNFASIEFSAES